MMNHANPWKITAMALGVIAVTALITTYQVAQQSDEQRKQRNISRAAPNGSIAHHDTVPVNVVDCNREAAEAGKGKTVGIVEDGAIGGPGGTAVGAGGGTLAQGVAGAGKGAAMGILVGAVGGPLYGLNENKQSDEQYRRAYASCMRSHGYE